MVSTITVASTGTYTTTYIALTTPWPWTPGCETQFVISTDPVFLSSGAITNYYSSTTSVSAFDPDLDGGWNVLGQPQWYSQTRCLPPEVTGSYSSHVALGSLVCPESWTMYDSTWNADPATVPYGGMMSCCPPSYTLQGTYVVRPANTHSGCVSPVTSGQTFVGLNGAGLYNSPSTTSALVTYTYAKNDFATGYMLVARYSSYPDSSSSSSSSSGSSSSFSSDHGAYLGLRVGLGVGIPLLFFIGSIIAFFLIRKRRRAKSQGLHNPPRQEFAPNATSQYQYQSQYPPPGNNAPTGYGQYPPPGLPQQVIGGTQYHQIQYNHYQSPPPNEMSQYPN